MAAQRQSQAPPNGRRYNLGEPDANYTPAGTSDAMSERELTILQQKMEIDGRIREERMALVEGMMQLSMKYIPHVLDKLDKQMTLQGCTRVKHTRYIDF